MRAALLILAAGAVPAAALAQDHAGHAGHHAPTPADTPVPAPTDAQAEPPMDHSQMDHSHMHHGAPTAPSLVLPPPDDAAPIPAAPPPAAAFTGPLHAADAHLGAERMAQERAAMAHEMGGMGTSSLRVERLEHRMHGGADSFLWDIRGFIGGDINRFRFKSEGEGAWSGDVEQADVQALYSRAITPFFDLQAGVRQDLTGPTRTHAVIGLYGMTPFLVEIDGSAYLSNKGDLTADVEAELDQRITQRLILQPRMEIALSAQDIPELGVGAGLDRIELGLRLRYEFTRDFAPYLGFEQEWRLGGSKDFARAQGDDPSVANFVAGVRFRF